jgi:Fic family protein
MGKDLTMTFDAPPFTLSAKAVRLVAEIAALAERFAIRMEQPDALLLRRANKIKSIRSSLAIEGNTLSEDQVSDILSGKPVVAPLRQIQEVKNAIAAYDLYPKLNPFSVKDLLKAHQVMMTALDDTTGQFRRSGVGVSDGKRVIHMAPPAANVPSLINNLFGWLKKAPDHLLVKSCAFHYEFEFIHPFADGNGRMGRLWQSLILGKWNPVFQFLPVENMVHASQKAYYDAINASSAQADCAPFIDFMLVEIHRTLDSRKGESKGAGIGIKIGLNIGINDTQKQILLFVKENRAITAAQLAGRIGIARRNIETNLAQLKKTGLLRRVGAKRNGHWEIISPMARTGGAG